MRLRVVIGVAAIAVGLGIAPAAHATGKSGFPDLPGMGAADKATSGTTAQTSGAKPAAHTNAAPPRTHTAASSLVSSVGADQATTQDRQLREEAKSIVGLPGAGAIPVLNHIEVGVGSAFGHSVRGAGGLIVLAGLGSFAALGGLMYLRRLGVL